MVTVDGRDIDYEDAGSGIPLVFVPGSYSTPAAWRPIQKYLPDRYRFISFSLCGYGATKETRSWDDCGPEHQLSLLEAVARQVGEPCHLVGHSFGASVAMLGAMDQRIDVLSIALFEANPLALLLESDRPQLFDEMQGMRQAFEQAYRDGEPDAAARIIDYWGGTGTYSALPGPVRDYCRSTAYANALDWHGWSDLMVPSEEYAKFQAPALVVRGAQASDAMVEITNVLAASLPDRQAHVVDGAGHFLISTHAKQCAELLRDFLETVENRSGS